MTALEPVTPESSNLAVSRIAEQIKALQQPPYVERHNWIARQIWSDGWKAGITRCLKIVQSIQQTEK